MDTLDLQQQNCAVDTENIHKFWNIYSPTLYRKSLQTPALDR